jgi:hypothetical protein
MTYTQGEYDWMRQPYPFFCGRILIDPDQPPAHKASVPKLITALLITITTRD